MLGTRKVEVICAGIRGNRFPPSPSPQTALIAVVNLSNFIVYEKGLIK